MSEPSAEMIGRRHLSNGADVFFACALALPAGCGRVCEAFEVPVEEFLATVGESLVLPPAKGFGTAIGFSV